MKKPVKFAFCISLLALSFSVSARAHGNEPILDTVIADTDAQFASALNRAREQCQAIATPVPSVPIAGSGNIRLEDITGQCVSNYEVVSAYPGLYRIVPSEENMRIIKVFRLTDARGDERRIEVYYTGGDWMRYGYTYFGMNAERREDRADAYFISALSTADREKGAVPPAVNPFNFQKLAEFISADFLNADGTVKSVFRSAVSAPASAK
jgi:hypothetical protein